MSKCSAGCGFRCPRRSRAITNRGPGLRSRFRWGSRSSTGSRRAACVCELPWSKYLTAVPQILYSGNGKSANSAAYVRHSKFLWDACWKGSTPVTLTQRSLPFCNLDCLSANFRMPFDVNGGNGGHGIAMCIDTCLGGLDANLYAVHCNRNILAGRFQCCVANIRHENSTYPLRVASLLP